MTSHSSIPGFSWWFEKILAVLAAVSLVIFNDIRANVADGRKAMEELNTRVAVVIERQLYQGQRMDAVERRFERFDSKSKNSQGERNE